MIDIPNQIDHLQYHLHGTYTTTIAPYITAVPII